MKIYTWPLCKRYFSTNYCVTLTKMVNCIAEISLSRQVGAQVGTDHTTKIKKPSCWIDSYSCEETLLKLRHRTYDCSVTQTSAFSKRCSVYWKIRRTFSRFSGTRSEIRKVPETRREPRRNCSLSLLLRYWAAPVTIGESGLVEKPTTATEAFRKEPYHNAYGNPSPADHNLPADPRQALNETITKFGDEMYDVFSFRNSCSQELWVDLICSFRPHSL